MLINDERRALENVKGMVSEKYRLISQFAGRTPRLTESTPAASNKMLKTAYIKVK